MDAKTYLSEILAFYKYKVDNNLCTMSEMNDAIHALEDNMEVHGTIDDLAKFYDVTPQNIRTTISRKLIAKPKRNVLYPFRVHAQKDGFSWRVNS